MCPCAGDRTVALWCRCIDEISISSKIPFNRLGSFDISSILELNTASLELWASKELIPGC